MIIIKDAKTKVKNLLKKKLNNFPFIGIFIG